jgi:acetyltransferase-like isoleucine patch superfamily enzyme
MTCIIDFYRRVRQPDLRRVLDSHRLVTPAGRRILSGMGVFVGQHVRIAPSTLRELVAVYNAGRLPPTETPFPDVLFSGLAIRESDRPLFSFLSDITGNWQQLAIHIGNRTTLGNRVSLAHGVIIGDDCLIADKCQICFAATLHHHVTVERCAFVGSQAQLFPHSHLPAHTHLPPRTLHSSSFAYIRGQSCAFGHLHPATSL